MASLSALLLLTSLFACSFANWQSDDEEALAWMGKLGFRFRRLDPFMNDYAHPRYEMMNNEWNLNNLGKRFQAPANDGSKNMK
uniref:Uncharacterized protein n=1 Tax=Plectus sambesii TaxID=2011161 RepID=A0A914V722_9BILA